MLQRLILTVSMFGLSGCATVSAQREAGPKQVFTSLKPVTALQSCISTKFEREDFPPTYVPKEAGGTYTYRINGTLFWTLDIVDLGDGRELRLYGANDRELRSRIVPCL